MKAIFSNGKVIMTILAAAICLNANAQYRRYRTTHVPQRVIVRNTTVVRPGVSVDVRVDNKLTKKDRHSMLISHLKHNKYITVKKYAAITGLKKSIAEAELDDFATGKDKTIRMVIVDGKKKYTLRRA